MKYLLGLFLFLFLTPFLHAWDTGSSQNLFIKYRLDDDWFLTSRSNFATNDGFDNLLIAYADLNVGRDFADNWSWEIGYRHFILKLGNRWQHEYRPLVNLQWSKQWEGWSFSNRHRLEFRFYGGQSEDRIRYRNETRILFPVKWTRYNLRPFFEEEFFYEFNGSGFNLNWVTVGVRIPLKPGVNAKVGYRWQAQKLNEVWNHRHVLVTGVSVFF